MLKNVYKHNFHIRFHTDVVKSENFEIALDMKDIEIKFMDDCHFFPNIKEIEK